MFPRVPRRRLAAVGAAAVILLIAAAVLGSRFASDSAEPTQTTEKGELVRFEDKRENLAISYPASWRRISSADPQVALVTGDAEASLLVRTADIGTKVGVESIGSAKKLTDKLVMSGTRVKQLRPPRRVDDLGGLPGWLYIYSFEDAPTGQRGAHAHYFLFRGETMITLVFQTLPAQRFTTYAPLFDRLAASFSAKSQGKGAAGSGA